MILVTGGLGFIGSALIKELNDRGREDIWVIDRFRDQNKWRNIRDLKWTNFSTPEELLGEQAEAIFSQISEIYHLGACSSTTETDMDFLWHNNVDFSKNLFLAACDFKCKFLYASSAATYGDGSHGFKDDHKVIEKLKPLNPYGYSKQLFDEWVLKQKSAPTTWFGIKFFNVFGPNEYHKGGMRSMIKQAYEQITSEKKINLFKSYSKGYAHGAQARDFVYVKDVCRAMVDLMESKKKKINGIYNMGSGKCRTFNDIAKITFKVLGVKEKIEYIEMPQELQKQYQYHTEAKMEKFSKVLPQFKFLALEQSISDYIQKHLQQENPYLDSRGESS